MSTLERKNFKVSFISERYFVDLRDKTITCTLEFTIQTPYGKYVDISLDNPYEIYRVTGKAICADEDEFDARLGKRIARTRAENKAYSKAVNVIAKIEDELKDILESISPVGFDYDVEGDSNTFAEKAGNCVDHNLSYIERLSKETKPARKVSPINPRNRNLAEQMGCKCRPNRCEEDYTDSEVVERALKVVSELLWYLDPTKL